MNARASFVAAGFAALLAGCSSEQQEDTSVTEVVQTEVVVTDSAEGEVDFDALLASLPEPSEAKFDADRAAEFAELSLACVDREYPNKPSHVADGDETVKPPRELHPAFYGCFDWHSAVHGHWAMVRLLKTFPDFTLEKEIRAKLDRNLTPGKIRAEIEYYRGEHHALFERPYGWGWLLRLQAELATWDDADGRRWAEIVQPLAAELSGMTERYLETLSVPVRAGTHHSTAFALTHIHDYAAVARDRELTAVIERRSRDFYGGDTDCPAAYEPSGEDFISPCLVEADLMRRVLDRDEFAAWLDRFLPGLSSTGFAPLRTPPEVRDLKDPKIGHLIGLSYQRAAAYRGIARALPDGDRRREVFERLAAVHRDDAVAKTFASGYGGEHWLASFAIYLFTDSGPYAATAR
jgi:hypothetical protein